jgi:hypothetical protein
MNVPDSRYEELDLDRRLIKILRCNRLVKTQVTAAKNRAFRPTATRPQGAETSARNRTYRPKPKDEILGSTSPRLSSGCPHCRHLPPEEQCIRKLFVHANQNPDWLTGIIVTDAPEGDRMRPKVTSLHLDIERTETIA